MDILALPDPFLRKVMRTMTMKDRLRIRLVCRGFKELVSNTHAGFINHGQIKLERSHWDPNDGFLSVTIGDLTLMDYEELDGDIEERMNLRSHLFSGITIGEFNLTLEVDYSPNFQVSSVLELIQRFTENFKIKQLNFEQHLEDLDNFRTGSQIVATCLKCKYHTNIWRYLPVTEKLLSLPVHDHLEILCYLRTSHPLEHFLISSDIFFKLLNVHNNLALSNVDMTSDDLKKALQMISVESSGKYVHIHDNVSTIVSLIKSCGINEISVNGETCGEFDVVKGPRKDPAYGYYKDSSLRLRYRNCWIFVDNCKWNGYETESCNLRFGTGREFKP
ncbi:hypothetical protein PRIPAC_84549 [Pristionchus pacificus]|nr:hypothetical protein PRIPAC_84549 [Pristionchus pacificus]